MKTKAILFKTRSEAKSKQLEKGGNIMEHHSIFDDCTYYYLERPINSANINDLKYHDVLCTDEEFHHIRGGKIKT